SPVERRPVGTGELVVSLGERFERSRRVPRERREHARLGGREPAAVEPTGVAEDDRSFGSGEGDRPPLDTLGELVLRRAVVDRRPPRPERVELTPPRAARHLLKRAGLLVDADAIDESLPDWT